MANYVDGREGNPLYEIKEDMICPKCGKRIEYTTPILDSDCGYEWNGWICDDDCGYEDVEWFFNAEWSSNRAKGKV